MKIEEHHDAGLARTRLRRLLAGDLDNIVLKSLRKEPERRYPSIEQFSEDIRRHLQGLPVTASPDSVSYRTGKFVRRNKVGVAASAIIVLVLAGGILATLRQARIAAANQHRAEKRFADVRKLANSLLFDIHDSIQDLPGSMPARKLLVEGAVEYLDDLAREVGNDSSLQRELAAAYMRVGDVQGYQFRPNLGDTRGALKSYRKTLAIDETLVKENPGSIPDMLNLARVSRRLSETESMNHNMTGALLEGQRAVQAGELLAAKTPQDGKVLEELIRDYQALAGIEGGNITANLGDSAAALNMYQKAVEIAEKLSAAESADLTFRRLLASTVLRYGDQFILTGDRHAAQKQYLRGQEIIEGLASANNATSQSDLAEVYSRLGDLQLADGDAKGAASTYRQGLEIYRVLFQSDSRVVNFGVSLGLAYRNLADAESRIGSISESLAALQSAQTILDQVVSVSPSAEARTFQGMNHVVRGEVLARTGKLDSALRQYQEALDIFSRLNVDDPNNVDSRLCLAATHNSIGEVLLQERDSGHATDAFNSALKLVQSQRGPVQSNAQLVYVVADSYTGLGDAMRLEASSRTTARRLQPDLWKQAQTFYEKSLQTWQEVREPGIISPDGFQSVLPEVVVRRLALCREALSSPTATVEGKSRPRRSQRRRACRDRRWTNRSPPHSMSGASGADFCSASEFSDYDRSVATRCPSFNSQSFHKLTGLPSPHRGERCLSRPDSGKLARLHLRRIQL